jgi:hypothetical protein
MKKVNNMSQYIFVEYDDSSRGGGLIVDHNGKVRPNPRKKNRKWQPKEKPPLITVQFDEDGSSYLHVGPCFPGRRYSTDVLGWMEKHSRDGTGRS